MSPKSAKKSNSTKNLVVVESPAKARTVERILGKEYVVKASLGHVRDLPKGELGVNLERDFAPSYVTLGDKRTVVKELKSLGQEAPSIYLATDPDREGEAISWHLVTAAGWNGHSVQRVVFHEITPQAVKEAFRNTRDIDMRLVNAQQARRILDRLVGYQISPLLWRRVQRGLSAGRVQSVALRMVVDREREIEAFVPRESWRIEATLIKQGNGRSGQQPFIAALHSLKGQKQRLDVPNESEAHRILEELKGATYSVGQVKQREVKQSPAPPFITSTLQQEAWRKLRFPAKKTMLLAQQLYEGLPLEKGESVGLITYMRTDSVQVAASAVEETRRYIQEKLGREYLPAKPRIYTRKAKGAQEAHEAIRPTSAFRTPDSVRAFLASEQLKLYRLVWQRMVASQMSESLSDSTIVDVEALCLQKPTVYIFRATGSVVRFPGFRALYMEGKDDTEGNESSDEVLPPLAQGDALTCKGLEPKQQFTKPPAWYNEATLIRALEEQGIGRPSTYAPIISTILGRHYVEKDAGRFKPTALGKAICDLLISFFSDIMDVNFTAHMEEQLDEIARGERQWVPMLKEFYQDFDQKLQHAFQEMPRVRVVEATDEVCEQCGKPMVIKTGRFGRFLACSGFPECRNSKPLLTRTGVDCPQCGGELVERRSRAKGKRFYGCSNYPTCSFAMNQRPIPEPCPQCGGLLAGSGRERARCTKCEWRGEIPTNEPVLQEV